MSNKRPRKVKAKQKQAGKPKSRTVKRSNFKQKAANDLVQLIESQGEFWHDENCVAYFTRAIEGHREHYRVRSQTFRRLIAGELFAVSGRIASGTDLTDALNAIEGRAIYGGEQYSASTRVARTSKAYYLDLGNSNWEAVAIDAEGWRIEIPQHVRFIRQNSQRGLPRPVAGAKSRGIWARSGRVRPGGGSST